MCEITNPGRKQSAPYKKTYRGLRIRAARGVHEAVFNAIRELFPDAASTDVLDCGAGTGALTARLHDAGYRVTAVDADISSWSVPSVVPLKLDFETDNWPEVVGQRSFDCVVCVEVIEHLSAPAVFLSRVASVLKPGGVAMVTTPNLFDAYSLYASLRSESFVWFSPRNYHTDGYTTLLPWWLISIMGAETGLRTTHVSWVGLLGVPMWKRLILRMLNRSLRALRGKRILRHLPPACLPRHGTPTRVYHDDEIITLLIMRHEA